MAKTRKRKHSHPETPEPPQVMEPHSTEERAKKKHPISDKEKGRERKATPGRKRR
ncbi:MAG TPA: hypothetical protein VF191_07050 [Cyclobacteriaceae bacterium]